MILQQRELKCRSPVNPQNLNLLISELKSTEIAIASLQKDTDIELVINNENFSALKLKKEKLEKEVKEKEEKWKKESELTRSLMDMRNKEI